MKSTMVMLMLGLLLGLNGCAMPQRSGDQARAGLGKDPGRIVVEGASYDEVFAAARGVLSDYRFGINRIDAARGVLTSYPKRTEGLVSFWDREQSTLGQEWEDLAHQQERTVRIEFERPDGQAEGTGPAPVRARVEVFVERVHRPDWRVESESIRLSSFARSRDSFGGFKPAEFREPIGQDLSFADRVAREIARRFE